MNTKTDNTWSVFGRKPNHVRKVGVEGNENAVIVDAELQDILIWGAGKAGIENRKNIVALRPEIVRVYG